MRHLIEAMIPMAFFAMIVLVIYFTSKYNYELKKQVIESGKEIDFPKRKWPILEFAFTLIGIGIGLLVSLIPHTMELKEQLIVLLTFSSVLVFGGAGLTTAYFVRRKLDK